ELKEDVSAELATIEKQCTRMDKIISRMLNITAYKTKRYAFDMEIFDLGVDQHGDILPEDEKTDKK
ncbi:MAG: hypothetical protein GWN14_22745, partial [candidate division Zixibacteria bacterium]|nr:hypothetical protein [Gammaproteobacteria bacterium]NIX58663.1 hypothetical protein [candidate division Zixibacteria bacterium]